MSRKGAARYAGIDGWMGGDGQAKYRKRYISEFETIN